MKSNTAPSSSQRAVSSNQGGISTGKGGNSSNQGAISTSQGGYPNSIGGIPNSMGGIPNSMGGISTNDHVSFVDGAVVDLVQGYGSIVEALPNVANRVMQMQTATEDMANTLEKRMRHLIDGYEYLDSISAQIPESIRETAVAHKKSMLDVAHVLGPSYEQNYNAHTKELDRLRAELQSIAHERVVVDVLTRQTIRHAKSKRNTGCGSGGGGGGNNGSNGNKSRIKDQPFEPIIIPSYAEYTQQQNTTNNPTQNQNNPNQKNSNPNNLPRYSARNVGPGSLMVPSMRQGVLPPEISNLKTTPSDGTAGPRKR